MGLVDRQSIKFSIVYFLMFLIGLNFGRNAVLLVYLFSLYIFLLFRHKLVVPRIFLLIILLYVCINLSVTINEIGVSLYSIIKFGVYPLFFLAFYEIGMYAREYGNENKDVIKMLYKLIFSFVLGNMCHMLADVLITDLSSLNLGRRILNDIWSHGTAPATIIAGWGCFTMPILLYAFEQRKNSKFTLIIGIIMQITYIVFSFAVATRLGIVNSILIAVLFVAFICMQKDNRINLYSILNMLVVVIIVAILAYKLSIYVISSNLYIRMTSETLSIFDSNGRLASTIYLTQHFTEALLGGGYFTNKFGLQQHSVLFEMYDLYGMLPFILLFIILVISVIKTVGIYKSKLFTNSDKRFIVLFFIAMLVYYFEEPVISSNFIITGILFAYLGISYAIFNSSDDYGYGGGTDGD